MATFVFFADHADKRRADGRNVVVASGADEESARAAGEALIGLPGALASFAAVLVDESMPPFVVEGHWPVGSRQQAVWPSLGRAGDFLPGA
jgi:hypothetical protein